MSSSAATDRRARNSWKKNARVWVVKVPALCCMVKAGKVKEALLLFTTYQTVKHPCFSLLVGKQKPFRWVTFLSHLSKVTMSFLPCHGTFLTCIKEGPRWTKWCTKQSLCKGRNGIILLRLICTKSLDPADSGAFTTVSWHHLATETGFPVGPKQPTRRTRITSELLPALWPQAAWRDPSGNAATITCSAYHSAMRSSACSEKPFLKKKKQTTSPATKGDAELRSPVECFLLSLLVLFIKK